MVCKYCLIRKESSIGSRRVSLAKCKKMQLDVGSEPYLSLQNALAYIFAIISITSTIPSKYQCQTVY